MAPTKRLASESKSSDENANKRQRREQVAKPVTPSSLDDVNDDCLLLILQHLPAEDLNSVAICSRRCRQLRSNNDSLDQTRTGTIVCTEDTSGTSIQTAFDAQGWAQVFSGNRTRLEIVGLESVTHAVDTFRNDNMVLPLPNVTSLVVSSNQVGGFLVSRIVASFAKMLPNLVEIDLSNVGSHQFDLRNVAHYCRRLQRVYWVGSHGRFEMGYHHHSLATEFTELYIDDSRIDGLFDIVGVFYVDFAPQHYYLFRHFRRLERLSIRNVTWAYDFETDDQAKPLSQEMLVKMVRNHPSLRWLRSDLSEANVAMLQNERPDITFVQ